jgi:hypothetical protein
MPSGVRYWTVVDDAVRVVEAPDRFLREMRPARGRAETTTKAYAEGLSLFLRWCDRTGRDWRTAARDMGLFMFWLRWTPGNGGQRRTVVPGPGARPVRGDGRINKVLTAVRMFLVHAVVNKEAPAWVLEQVYELGDDRDLPVEAKGESGGLRYRLRARHRLQEPESEVDRASDEEVVAMFRACRSARDRLNPPSDPLSECTMQPGCRRLRPTAMFSASTTREARWWSAIEYPTISRVAGRASPGRRQKLHEPSEPTPYEDATSGQLDRAPLSPYKSEASLSRWPPYWTRWRWRPPDGSCRRMTAPDVRRVAWKASSRLSTPDVTRASRSA